jgi:hypothetical protein
MAGTPGAKTRFALLPGHDDIANTPHELVGCASRGNLSMDAACGSVAATPNFIGNKKPRELFNA